MAATDDWTRPDWLAEVRAWIAARLDEHGLAIVGDIEQPHLQWWSTALRVPTSDGDVFFKASRPSSAFEGPLTELLGREQPRRTAELLAVEPERAWMLTRDAGTRLREAAPGPEQLTHWERLLPPYAELQLALAPRADELLALGVTDLRLPVLPPLLERACAERELLVRDDEDGMTPEELSALDDALPRFRELCGRLDESGIRPSLQHDDLHDGNVFVRDGDHVVFDWGDACISHPFHTLVVTLRVLGYRLASRPAGTRSCGCATHISSRGRPSRRGTSSSRRPTSRGEPGPFSAPWRGISARGRCRRSSVRSTARPCPTGSSSTSATLPEATFVSRYRQSFSA